MSRNKLVLTLCTLGVLPAIAAAQPARPIAVDVRFELPAMTQSWPQTSREPTRLALRERLLTELAARERLALWDFSAEQRDAIATLTFRVTRGVPGEARLVVGLRANGTLVDHEIEQVWMKPGDAAMQGWPAGEQLAAAFVRLLLSPEEEGALHDVLRHVPIASAAKWVGALPDLRLVLALPWAKYERLSESRFRLECRSATEQDLIISEARGVHAAFEPPLPDQPYDALLVVPVERRNSPLASPSTPSLKVEQVFLDLYRPRFSWTTATP